ncbi:CML24 [Symbiodinium microadriaticum]|nr:CML24 [Symbiodinium microadriaticum]
MIAGPWLRGRYHELATSLGRCSMDGEGAEEDRKNKKTPKDKKEKKEKKDKKGKEQESTDVPATVVGAVTADSSPSAVEVKPKKLKAKKEKKEKKAEPLDPEDLQGLPDEAKDAEEPEDREAEDRHRLRPSQVASEFLAEPVEAEVAAEAAAEAEAAEAAEAKVQTEVEIADEPRASDPALQQFVGEQPAGEEETGDFPEVRVALPDDEVEPLMSGEHRRSEVPSLPAEDVTVMTGPPPLQLGKGSGLAHDINIPEREALKSRVLDGTASLAKRACAGVSSEECDLIWDMAVTHCSRCQKQLVEGSIQVTELLNGSQHLAKEFNMESTRLEFLEQAFKRYDVDGSGRLDGKELRMAVRELGWVCSSVDTKQDILDRWARSEPSVGGNQGLNLDQFKNLIASGKLGRKTFKPITGKASQAVKDERRQLLAMGGAAPQFTARQRPGRRGALIPGATQELAPDEQPPQRRMSEEACQSVFEELPAHRKLELIEADRVNECFERLLDPDMVTSAFMEESLFASMRQGWAFTFPSSVQIKHRDEELGLWKGANALPLEEEGLDEEDSTTLRAKRKKELAKAELNLRRTSVTDKNFRWRNLLCTSHATVGEYAVGVRLYFDLLLLLVIAFGVPVLDCRGAEGVVRALLSWILEDVRIQLRWRTDDVLSTLAKYSVGNLVRQAFDQSDVVRPGATVHIMNEFFGSMAQGTWLLGVLLLYRFVPVIIHRATYTTNSRNLANLAIQVRGLPTDLGYHHLGYEELLRAAEHFQTVAYEQALRVESACVDCDDVSSADAESVVLWRNYDAAVHGVLRQVDLQAKQFSVNTELKFLEQKARRRQSTKGRQTMKVMADRIRAVQLSLSTDKTAVDTKGGKRLAKRQTYLLSMNDLIEEQILEIETERALHSDLKPEEREVMGAFVVFWCQRTRDAVLGQYGWSRPGAKGSWVSVLTRLKLPFEAFPLIVEATQDPSLQLWQNMDVKPLMRLQICVHFADDRFDYRFESEAKVWLITNVSEPVVSSSDDARGPGSMLAFLRAGALWGRVSDCQEQFLQFFFALVMVTLAMTVSVHQRFQVFELLGGHQPGVCGEDLPRRPWLLRQPTFGERRSDARLERGRAGGCLGRSSAVPEHGHFQVRSLELRQIMATARRSGSAGKRSYNLSLITYTIRYQTKASSLAGATAIQTLLKTSLASALGLNPMTLSDTSSVRQPYIFSVQPPLESLPPPVLGPGCGDSPDAVPQLLQWLGLSGPATRMLTSCKDFARMGLLGVPFCDNVPQDYRCLCAETCGCPCAGDTCDCQAPALGVDLLPLPEPGEVITWETDLRICSQDGDQLAALTCGFSDIFDTRQSNPSLAALAETWLQSQRELGIFPITVFQGPPVGGGCNSALQCGLGSVRCYSRFNEQVCAKRCDGIEECLNATDELGCRFCGSVAGSSTQSQCTMPVGRCTDHQTSASACQECSNITQLSTEEAKLCSVLNIPAGATAEGAKQCNASFCDVLQPGGECDPGSLSYDPCRPDSSRSSARSDLPAFDACSTVGLLSLFHFDAIRAKLVEDWFGSHILECHNSEGSSGGCAVTSVDRVEGLALLLAGTDWLQSAAEVPAPSAHAIHMWVMSTCTSCTIAGLLGGGTLYVDGSGYLAAKSPSGTAWQPAAGPLLNDGNFHFVAFSLGASHGEVLLADGTVLAQRSFQDAQSAGWSSQTPVKVMFGKSQTEAALGNYSGEIDVAAVFTTELSLKELRHHMLAGSWRGPGACPSSQHRPWQDPKPPHVPLNPKSAILQV